MMHRESLRAGVDADQPDSLPLASELSHFEGLCLHDTFETRAAQQPRVTATLFEGRELTCGDLNRRANRLAHYLLSSGTGLETPVGIYMARSMELAVAVLGVLKAGAVCVPLDPDYPQSRLRAMAGDAGASILLTQKHLVSTVPCRNARIVPLDDESEALARQGDENPGIPVGPDNLAFVFYTSGSTGRPKGVMTSHRVRLSRLVWAQRQIRLRADDRHVLKSSISFSAVARDIFWPLLNGASLVIARPGGHSDVGYLVELIAQHRVTVISFVPSVLQVFLDEPGLSECHCLRHVLCGGEALTAELEERFFERLPAKLHRFYGATEAPAATYSECRPGAHAGAVNIGGRTDVPVYLLDAHLNPVPSGEPGEIYIGGVAVTRGYLQLPGLTAERFLPNPFAERSGERFYKTGDLGRQLLDGNLEFLGRSDHQIKIRGVRVEPGEVERQRARHANLRDVAVIAREDVPGETRLVAYLVCAREPAPAAAELQGFLRATLPEVMVPSAFVTLESLPLSTNGKLDRRALPPPTTPARKLGRFEPRSPTERTVAEIWSKVLTLDRVGANDNFFEIGGHSLRAAQVISRIRSAFEVDLPLQAIFENPSVAALAKTVEQARASDEQAVRPISKRSGTGPTELSPAQQGLWFLEQLDPQTAAYNIHIAARLRGPLTVEALDRSLDAIVRRHEALRTTFRLSHGQPVQVITQVGASRLVGLRVVDLGHVPVAERQAAAEGHATMEARLPFDLERGPLVRASLLRFGSSDNVLLLTLHHIVCDGWSISVLMRELFLLYGAFSAGRPSPLDELPIQYADFTDWERGRLSGARLNGLLSYWRSQLGEGVSLSELPTDRPRPAKQTYEGATLRFAFSAWLSGELRSLSRREEVTVFMTLVGAFQVNLRHHTRRDVVTVATDVARRDTTETEAMIGMFVNQLVLRTDLSGNPSFREVLRRTRSVALEAFSHQELPFYRVVDALTSQRDLSRSPLFQAKFVLQNAPGSLPQVPGLSVDFLEIDNGTAKFELLFNMVDKPSGIGGKVEYRIDLFERSTVVCFLADFESILRTVVRQPDIELETLSDLLAQESRRRELDVARELAVRGKSLSY